MGRTRDRARRIRIAGKGHNSGRLVAIWPGRAGRDLYVIIKTGGPFPVFQGGDGRRPFRRRLPGHGRLEVPWGANRRLKCDHRWAETLLRSAWKRSSGGQKEKKRKTAAARRRAWTFCDQGLGARGEMRIVEVESPTVPMGSGMRGDQEFAEGSWADRFDPDDPAAESLGGN